jgi:hypothetical protein
MVVAFLPGVSGVVDGARMRSACSGSVEVMLLFSGARRRDVHGIGHRDPVPAFPPSERGDTSTVRARLAKSSEDGYRLRSGVGHGIEPPAFSCSSLIGHESAVYALGHELLMLLLWTDDDRARRTRLIRGPSQHGIGLLSFIGQDRGPAKRDSAFGTLFQGTDSVSFPRNIDLFDRRDAPHQCFQSPHVAVRSRIDQLSGVREGAMTVRHFGLFLRGDNRHVRRDRAGRGRNRRLTRLPCRQFGQNPERFGKGDIRGVLAPSAIEGWWRAHSDACLQHSTTKVTSVPLAALLLHGIAPGRELMTISCRSYSCSSNYFSFRTGSRRLWNHADHAAAATRQSGATAGSHRHRVGGGRRVVDVTFQVIVVAVAFGGLDYSMKKHGWPRIPMLVALLVSGGIGRNRRLRSGSASLDVSMCSRVHS